MQDFLEYLFNKYGYDPKFIRQIAVGQRYIAVELVNGNIGVCATLSYNYKKGIPKEVFPEIYSDRLFLTAYYNALLNYRTYPVENNKDIYDLKLENYRQIVFIGKFDPVFEKLRQRDIKYSYIDLRDTLSHDNQINNKEQLLSIADLLIISATAITNQTLNEIIENSPYSEKYILGPSSILSPDLSQWGINGIFGLQFNPYDSRVLGVISLNYGTRYFIHRGNKVLLKCKFMNTI